MAERKLARPTRTKKADARKNNGAVLGFEQKMNRLPAKLGRQSAESAKLETLIRANLKGLGYGR